MYTSSDSFEDVKRRILRLKNYRVKINKLNLRYLRETWDVPKASSIAVRQTLCPKCPEDHTLCEDDLDSRRRYYCKELSLHSGSFVRLYLPSKTDNYFEKESLKREIMQFVQLNRGASQNKIAGAMPRGKQMVRECLDELTMRGLLRCKEDVENNRKVLRYYVILD
jgi:hypothetical protein